VRGGRLSFYVARKTLRGRIREGGLEKSKAFLCYERKGTLFFRLRSGRDVLVKYPSSEGASDRSGGFRPYSGNRKIQESQKRREDLRFLFLGAVKDRKIEGIGKKSLEKNTSYGRFCPTRRENSRRENPNRNGNRQKIQSHLKYEWGIQIDDLLRGILCETKEERSVLLSCEG